MIFWLFYVPLTYSVVWGMVAVCLGDYKDLGIGESIFFGFIWPLFLPAKILFHIIKWIVKL